ncbi:MAG: exodeoxyribonuclease VII large subunit [Arenicellales bacterium]|jgi:exodeoxyribonuclease VII large subunit|nr:exodeoxyribonuclease VII large subunit [Arenicellales bacterium]MDP6854472.1 exodeoxyribonuclease VII large subunit [Arenicellales bacterium]MDP6948836.1 exodeoxyribonuclease VII large subunit [Arenicellales bacterium]
MHNLLVERTVYTVSQFTRAARELLEENFADIWLEGEISNLATPASGHKYFSLKDENAQVRCALFRNRRIQPAGALANGATVLVRAVVSLYEPRGDFQLIIEHLEPVGEGELRRRLEVLKQRLDKDGLFDPSSKRPLPPMPRRIAAVTSATGAAIRDILATLARRFPLVEVDLYAVTVQGPGAGPEIAAALAAVGHARTAEVVILARGGGSLEDLWAFNEEIVVRAVRSCPLPVVSGIGHQTDFTLVDFAADLRAATPTAAAEATTPDREELLQKLRLSTARLHRALQHQLRDKAQQLDVAAGQLHHPLERLQHQLQVTDNLEDRLSAACKNALAGPHFKVTAHAQRLNACSPRRRLPYLQAVHGALQQRLADRAQVLLTSQRQRLVVAQAQLDALSPRGTLARGYAIVHNLTSGTLVRSADDAPVGARVQAELAAGWFKGQVEETGTTPMASPVARPGRFKPKR